MEWALALVLKPFVALVVFFLAMLLARLVGRWIPEGRIKRVLFAPLHRRR